MFKEVATGRGFLSEEQMNGPITHKEVAAAIISLNLNGKIIILVIFIIIGWEQKEKRQEGQEGQERQKG